MAMSNRDDFSKATIEKLAQRAGYRCSKPDCGIPTRGAASDEDGTINIGVAAHISAASPGGKRYDPSLTSAERKSLSNGIWLCQNDAKLIDSDELNFPVEKLRAWKRLAEHRSFLEILSPKPNSVGETLSDDSEVQTIIDLLRACSISDLKNFQRMPGWPSYPITLNLKMADHEGTELFPVSGLASTIEVFNEIAVIAPPGTGKTTTLLQLAESIISLNHYIAVFIPLSEWSARPDTFFLSFLRRGAFRHATECQFELLAENGKLVLILDGWNELDEPSKRRARTEVKSLLRDFPDIRFVVSSRNKDFDIPVNGPVVEISVLTEEQQLEIAKALRGSEGESLMDHAWRTRGLRELTVIPLYLVALLKQTRGGTLPTNKEEILRGFVAELEQDPDKFSRLRSSCQGFHRDFLIGIAVKAIQNGSVVISESQARAEINNVQEKLGDSGQISQFFQPMRVLDSLVDSYMLVRSGSEEVSYSIQHQQLQEWFASYYVQHLMLLTGAGDTDAKKELREKILDIPIWEEAILFACDRLSRADQDGIQAVAKAIIETLEIDPMLSAEMIYRSSDEVWEQAKAVVMSFAGKWHNEERVDRAFKFMIETGRAEFSEYVWPLISDPDDQIHLHALRAGRIFRIGVLGSDAQEKILKLPEKVRMDVVGEIARDGDIDSIEFVTNLAKIDESLKVKEAIVNSLMFRRADSYVKKILLTAPNETWHAVALKWSHREVADPVISARLREEAEGIFLAENDPLKALRMLLFSQVNTPEIGTKIRALIEKIDFSNTDRNDNWFIHDIQKLYPEDLVGALVSLLESGKPVPAFTDELLRKSDLFIDEGPLVENILHNSKEYKGSELALCIVGPKTIGELIEKMFEIHIRITSRNEKYDENLSDEYFRLSRWISKTKPELFFQVILERAATDQPDRIAFLSRLIYRHGGSVEQEPIRLENEIHKCLTTTVHQWAEILLNSPEATREQFAEIAQAVERLRSPSLATILEKLLSEELTRRKRAVEEFREARKKRLDIRNEGFISWTLQYERAFAAIGGDQTIQIMESYLRSCDFGFEAARVLMSIWEKTHPPEEKPGFLKLRPKLPGEVDEDPVNQSMNGDGTHLFVNKILAVVEDLIKPETKEADCKHALKLATIAFNMPFKNKDAIIAKLLQTQVPKSDKLGLLSVLARSGETIPAQLVMQGIEELFEEAKTKPWMLKEQDGWRLSAWIQLLPFTETPDVIFDVLSRVKDHYSAPWRFRSLLSALSTAPSIKAENILIELARRDERFLNEYSWLEAVTRRNSPSMAKLLLDLVCNTSLSGKKKIDYWMYAREFSVFMKSYGQLREEIYERYSQATDRHIQSMLEYIIANSADADGVLLIVRIGATQSKRFRETALHTALDHFLVGRISTDSPGMYELSYSPAPELRKDLFSMVVNGNAAESRLASECLNAIDETRDSYGYSHAEPRHPNIAMGAPWPQIALAHPA
jgi:hypothetical protein